MALGPSAGRGHGAGDLRGPGGAEVRLCLDQPHAGGQQAGDLRPLLERKSMSVLGSAI